jgi:uncharacterized membrane protein YphA (DoxX/SURF4 family)
VHPFVVKGHTLNLTLWIAAILGAFMFGMAGIMKMSQPKEKLAPKMPWVNEYSANNVKLVGLAELLGAIGLILPWATGIAKVLTPLAALGLALIMVLAAIHHARRKEFQGIGVNVVLFAISIFVAIGRF